MAAATATNAPAQRAPRPRSNTSCLLLPHGGYTLIPATLSTMAWIASLAQDGCDYSQLTGPTVDDLLNINGVPYLEVGFNAYRAPDYYKDEDEWRVDYESKCSEYNPEVVEFDTYWKVGKAFEFLSLVMGGGCALFLWFATCFVFSPGTWRWTGFWALTASIFQAVAFLWFATAMCQIEGNTCALFFGSKADIVAASFWFTSSVAILCWYPTPRAKEGDASARNGVGGGGGGGRGEGAQDTDGLEDSWSAGIGSSSHGGQNDETAALGDGVDVEEMRLGNEEEGMVRETSMVPTSSSLSLEDDDDDFEMMDLPLEGMADAKMTPSLDDPGAPGPRTKAEDAEMV